MGWERVASLLLPRHAAGEWQGVNDSNHYPNRALSLCLCLDLAKRHSVSLLGQSGGNGNIFFPLGCTCVHFALSQGYRLEYQ